MTSSNQDDSPSFSSPWYPQDFDAKLCSCYLQGLTGILANTGPMRLKLQIIMGDLGVVCSQAHFINCRTMEVFPPDARWTSWGWQPSWEGQKCQSSPGPLAEICILPEHDRQHIWRSGPLQGKPYPHHFRRQLSEAHVLYGRPLLYIVAPIIKAHTLDWCRRICGTTVFRIIGICSAICFEAEDWAAWHNQNWILDLQYLIFQ